MSRNIDIIAVGFIVVFTCVCSAVGGLVRTPVFQRYNGVTLEQQIEERIEPKIQKIHENIERSIERHLGKMKAY